MALVPARTLEYDIGEVLVAVPTKIILAEGGSGEGPSMLKLVFQAIERKKVKWNGERGRSHTLEVLKELPFISGR